MPRFPAALLATLGLLAALPLLAQTEPAQTDHSGHAAAGSATPATEGFAAANARMHAAMDIPYTGNADVDFIAGMIAHHQGAVEMAQVVLEHGKDPEVRKFAESVIAAQGAEIVWMTDWLARKSQ